MNEKQMTEIIRRTIISDISLTLLFAFLKEKGLEEEARKYLKEVLKKIKVEDWREMTEKFVNSLFEKEDVNTGSVE